MKSSNRALAIFGAAIGLLALVTLVLVLVTGNRPVKLLPGDTPQGVVQRYLLAIDQSDYLTAWNYLAPQVPDGKPQTYEQWRQSFTYPADRPAYKATLGASRIDGGQATVDVVIDTFRQYNGLFGNPVSTTRITFFLQQDGGTWKITDPTYVSWIY